MAVNKSALVGGMGVAMTIVQTLVAEVKKAGGKEDDIHRLATPDAWDVWQEIAKVIVRKEEELVESIDQLFTVTVRYKANYFDYQHKWDEVAGPISDSWDSMMGGTWQHNPVEEGEKSEKEVVFKLFPCKVRGTISEDIVAVMDREGYRPAIRQELLAFGQFKPALQRRYKIVALGSVLRLRGQARQVPLLRGSNTWREVALREFDKTWDSAEYLFLGVGRPVQEMSIVVVGSQLLDRPKEAIQKLFPGQRVRFHFTNPVDSQQHDYNCQHLKADLVVVPEDSIPTRAMDRGTPHVMVRCPAWPSECTVLELLPSKPEFKPYIPKAQ